VIAVEAPRLRLGGRVVLQIPRFVARPGELVALCGPNGAGKSTLLRAMAGLLPGFHAPDPRRVAYLPQEPRCAWGLRIEEVAALGRIPHGDSDYAAIDAALMACGVDDLRTQRIDAVSGGQARRAMLARVFATAPSVLLLDEPTSGLDPAAAHEIMALLHATAGKGYCVVVVLHAIDLALRHADRMVVLQAGRIIADAPPNYAMPAAAAAFGLPWGIDTRPRLLPPEGTCAASR
jgi:iron complex transport system ATP-binding protein